MPDFGVFYGIFEYSKLIFCLNLIKYEYAVVAELADAIDSRSIDRKVMRVRLPPAAPLCRFPLLL